MTQAEKRAIEKLYTTTLITYIRRFFSESDEIAIIRQKEEHPEKFAIYNEFVEKLKADLKKELGIGDEVEENETNNN